MRENEKVPDIERLSRHEFDLDIEEQTRLQAEGEAEVQRVSENTYPQLEANIWWYLTCK